LKDGRIKEPLSQSRLSAVRRSPLTDQVVEQLTKRILSGDLAPGTLLRQAQLAAQLSVSRTPLREAMHVLLTDGLLTKRPNGIFAVIVPTLADARDTYELREVIDAFAARMAATRATDDQITELQRLVERLEKTCEPFDAPRYLEAVTDYHVGLLKASGNQTIRPLETTIRMSTRVLYPQFSKRKDRLIAAAREHRRLFEAIRDRNPDQAEYLARDHVRNVIKFWIEQPDSVSVG